MKKEDSCVTCIHSDASSLQNVQTCKCCENMCFYEKREAHVTKQ